MITVDTHLSIDMPVPQTSIQALAQAMVMVDLAQAQLQRCAEDAGLDCDDVMLPMENGAFETWVRINAALEAQAKRRAA